MSNSFEEKKYSKCIIGRIILKPTHVIIVLIYSSIVVGLVYLVVVDGQYLPMHTRSLLVLAICGLISTCTPNISHAQPPDLYERLVDPRALPRLNDSLSRPIRAYCQIDPYEGIDTVDNYVILRGDTGCGVLTHFWLAYDCPDSLTGVKLWVDDNLVAAGTINEFFTQVHEAFRPPLIYYARGGQDCDIQIVFRRNWRMTFKQTNTPSVLYTNFEYRPIDPSLSVSTFNWKNVGVDQARAEAQYSSPLSQWQNRQHTDSPKAISREYHGTVSYFRIFYDPVAQSHSVYIRGH